MKKAATKKRPVRAKRPASRKPAPALVVLVLDESGSMEPYTRDVIGGTNRYVEALGDTADLAVVKFHSTVAIEQVYIPASKMPKVTEHWYKPQAMTALFDAVGEAVRIGDDWSKKNKAGRVVVTIYTDGQENASTKLTMKQVSELVKDRTAKGWEFIYLGAHGDAWQQGQNIGTVSTSTYHYGAGQTVNTMQAAGAATARAFAGRSSVSAVMSVDPAMAAAGVTLAEDEEKKKRKINKIR